MAFSVIFFFLIKSKITREGHAYLQSKRGQTFYESEKMKQRKDKYSKMKSCRQLFPCVSLCLLSS